MSLLPSAFPSAKAYTSGMAVSLGVSGGVTDQVIGKAVSFLLNDKLKRQKMAALAKQKVDARGARRIAHLITSEIKNRNVREKVLATT